MTPGRILVVGLGPAPGTLTETARAAIDGSNHRFLRTARHPSAPEVGECVTFDHLYDGAATFEKVYRTIVANLIDAAREHGEVLYAVPGSPLVAEHTVVLLREAQVAGLVTLEVLPALSFADLAWSRLGLDPLAAGVRLIDGARFATEAAGERGPLLVAQCHSAAVLSDIKLSVDEAPAGLSATILHHLGLADEHIVEVPWAEIDRTVDADHLTTLYIPRLEARIAPEVALLTALTRTLRATCPWDKEQTEESLARYVVEEAYELVETIDRLGREERDGGDPEQSGAVDHYIEELGDVLFQVVFHAVLGEERGWFTLADVARAVHDKLVHRHPHVFARETFDTAAGSANAVESAGDVVRNWEQIKAVEKAGRVGMSSDPFADVPSSLPALTYAAKILKRAEKLGVTVPGAQVGDADGLAGQLLALVSAARRLDLDAETVLRQACGRLRQQAISI